MLSTTPRQLDSIPPLIFVQHFPTHPYAFIQNFGLPVVHQRRDISAHTTYHGLHQMTLFVSIRSHSSAHSGASCT